MGGRRNSFTAVAISIVLAAMISIDSVESSSFHHDKDNMRSFMDSKDTSPSPTSAPTFRRHRSEDDPREHDRKSLHAVVAPSDPNLLYSRGGPILTTAITQAIFLGPTWAGYPTNTAIAEKVNGVDSFYTGYGDSWYAKTTTEYNGTNGYVSGTTTHLGHIIDTTASPVSGTDSVKNVQAAVCRNIVPDPSGNGYYSIFSDVKRNSTITGYCGWHSYGACNGIPVQFSFIWNLDGDGGCDPGDNSKLHSQGLAAIVNVAAHELAETVTDPRFKGWLDTAKSENGDKCCWAFNAPLVTFSDGNKWKLQGQWSNAAYLAGTGYPNLGGLPGCVSGFGPSQAPTPSPTRVPLTGKPSVSPTSKPTGKPITGKPSVKPSLRPSSIPTRQPSIYPTVLPTVAPSTLPSGQPSSQPTKGKTANVPPV